MLEVVVFVDGIWKVCSVACGPIQFPAFNGSCPINCSGNGKCLKNGICECVNGIHGFIA
ncbi:hypothetical protein HanRHA438_Chr05g0207471 [Helianthus annuus]|uniref:Uncharacterized protein n=1 Tax=Helianthus annuus TaxID=4232 RepID=A0A9K3NLW7_HELAN|nr:hypothetical protein HanXRQr2_Chr05g0197901 [Helianthus annuus]KAJ0569128.1 hypothetical protein HanHA300_Chr05g0162511 [Helianthus annuus]KAJ0575515.1 hypothetical protein HanIR_Chr05g0213621 [Helianthus annuus]KAJ0583421.1 hypothetical protein HanHA89_Chr05g0176361 [Helianthus annuus]KAJ0746157.1 hypothetical protein HanOQP8_Chr05g0174311 [Helianthus annuus]